VNIIDFIYRYQGQFEKSLKWEHVIYDLFGQNLDNIFKLVIVLQQTCVKCEATFSAMKLLRNKRRGRLETVRLNDLMTIQIMSPSIEQFDPEPAISDWMVIVLCF
jgi:hypothetical protein